MKNNLSIALFILFTSSHFFLYGIINQIIYIYNIDKIQYNNFFLQNNKLILNIIYIIIICILFVKDIFKTTGKQKEYFNIFLLFFYFSFFCLMIYYILLPYFNANRLVH